MPLVLSFLAVHNLTFSWWCMAIDTISSSSESIHPMHIFLQWLGGSMSNHTDLFITLTSMMSFQAVLPFVSGCGGISSGLVFCGYFLFLDTTFQSRDTWEFSSTLIQQTPLLLCLYYIVKKEVLGKDESTIRANHRHELSSLFPGIYHYIFE